MIPLKIRYTGYTFDPMDLLHPRNVAGVFPTEWERVSFKVMNADVNNWEKTCRKIENWISDNTDGQWSWYHYSNGIDFRRVVVGFELDTDFVMFRLKSGETAWQNEEEEEF